MRSPASTIGRRVWRLGADVDTDALAPGAWMKYDVAVIAQHCLEATHPQFALDVRCGDVIVAGPNFGIGSSREQAVSTLKLRALDCRVRLDEEIAKASSPDASMSDEQLLSIIVAAVASMPPQHLERIEDAIKVVVKARGVAAHREARAGDSGRLVDCGGRRLFTLLRPDGYCTARASCRGCFAGYR